MKETEAASHVLYGVGHTYPAPCLCLLAGPESGGCLAQELPSCLLPGRAPLPWRLPYFGALCPRATDSEAFTEAGRLLASSMPRRSAPACEVRRVFPTLDKDWTLLACLHA